MMKEGRKCLVTIISSWWVMRVYLSRREKKQRRRGPGQRLQRASRQTGPGPAGPGWQAGLCSAAVAGQVTGTTAHLGVGVVWCHPSLAGPELRGSDCGPHLHLPEQVSRLAGGWGWGDEPVSVWPPPARQHPAVPGIGPLRSRAGCRSNLELGSCSATCEF